MEIIKPLPPRMLLLTNRQAQVFRLLGQGKDFYETGEALNISHKTVANHKTAIFKRMGFNHIYKLIYYYLKFVEQVK